MIHAPDLKNISAETTVEIGDLAPKFNRYGPDCVRYNLEFAKIWDQWESNKKRYLR